MYPPVTGSEHMRQHAACRAGMKMFPGYLREAGYYCTNNAKEDYNLEKPARSWDDSARRRALAEPRTRGSRSSRSSTT